MYCDKCGKYYNVDEKYCSGCGTSTQQNNVNNPNNNYYVSNSKQAECKNESMGIASMVIGIISLVLCLFLNILILPLAVLGIILGIVNKAKKGKMISGIILNGIAITIIILICMLVITVIKSGPFTSLMSELSEEIESQNVVKYVSGKYDCTSVTSSNQTNYIVTVHFYQDNTFLFGPYGDMENNYAKGSYTVKDEHKTNESGTYKYYMINFHGNEDEFIIDGEIAGRPFESQAEFGITRINGQKSGVLMFTNTYNTYYCYDNNK